MNDIERVKRLLGGYNHDLEHAEIYQSLRRTIEDAERYRYLRDHHMREWVSDLEHNKGAPSLDLDFSAEGHDLDAAIDRAMRR